MLIKVQDTLHNTVFFTKEIWFYIFGTLILLYVIATMYNRIKRPKKEIKTVKAKVLSITSARVQTNHRDTGFDKLMSGGTAIPGARFEVTLIDDSTGESYVFAISESKSEKLSVGKTGTLCFNGDEFISFGDETEQGKLQKIYFFKKRVLPLAICGVIVIGLGFWAVKYFFFQKDVKEQYEVQESVDRPLTVYMSSQMAEFNGELSSGSQYHLGEFTGLGEKWGDSSHIYYDAIVNYKKSTGRDVKIEFFNVPEEMMQRAYEEWKNGIGPDVIVGDYTNNGCLLYPYISEGMFEDMSGYFEEDALYSSGEYVTKVLEGGRIGDSQLVFPLTFNMNMLFTSEERMKEHEIWLSEGMLYEEMLVLFRDEWNSVRDEDEYLMIQSNNMMRNRYPILIFQSASGLNMIDYETGKILLSMEDFSDWAILYESYICDEYQMSREELKEYAVQNPDCYFPVSESKLNILQSLRNGLDAGKSVSDFFDITKDDIFCWVEGGAWTTYFHSFAAHAGYYESRLKEDNETFIPMAIPCKESGDEYAAEITSYGVILSGSMKADEAYEFIKALADHEHFLHFDLSVNCQVLANTLEELCETTYSLNLAVAQLPSVDKNEIDIPNTSVDDEEKIDWFDVVDYEIQPLSEETKEYLLEVVDNIGCACLPEGQLDLIIIEEIGRYIWGDVDTIEDAYDNTIQRFVEKGYLY